MLKFLFIWDIKKKKKESTCTFIELKQRSFNKSSSGQLRAPAVDMLEDEHMKFPDQNIHLLPSWDRGSVALCQSEADIDSDDLQGDQEVEGQV